MAFKLAKDVQGDLYNTPTCSRLPLGNNSVVHSASMLLLWMRKIQILKHSLFVFSTALVIGVALIIFFSDRT